MATQPLIVIVGPTASGKTAMAIKLAKQFNGEIICADSRTVYKDLDIGTAKPSGSDRKEVPHWGLDLVGPGERYTAAEFQNYAMQKIGEIRARGHVPFLVGGTGLYIDSVIFDYQFPAKPDESQREIFEKMTLDELYKYCIENNIELPENDKNKRYIIRSIEKKGLKSTRRDQILTNTFIVGITTDSDSLRANIALRIEQLLENGVIEEANRASHVYGWESEAMKGNIYKLSKKYLAGESSLDELRQEAITTDWQLAKRQLTWFRRNKFIKWLSRDDAEHYIASILASVS